MKDIKTKIIKIFKDGSGYSTLKSLVKNRIHTSYIKKLMDEKVIEKIKPGVYKLTDYDFNELSGFIEVCKAVPYGVICNISALSYYEMTSENSYIIDVAIPNDRKGVKIFYPPVKYHFFRDSVYKLGINRVNTENGSFKIYNREKTICDIFRNRRFFGEEILIECLKEYLKQKDNNVNKLYQYADICRVRKNIFQYVKILSG